MIEEFSPRSQTHVQQSRSETTVAIDAHVHFYPGYDIDRFLKAASDNLSSTGTGSGGRGTGNPLGVLCLTESADCAWFEWLQRQTKVGSGWRVEPTREPCSLRLIDGRDRCLVVIAGHQVVTTEKIEVLVIGQVDKPADGPAAHELIASQLASEQPIVILPWGFGKWLGRRGVLIRSLIDAFGSEILVGDNSGRLSLTPPSGLIRYARDRGLKVLSGSDPLPLPNEESTVGRLSNSLNLALDADEPFNSIKVALRQAEVIERGRYEGPIRFARHQWQMQLRKAR
jgi:hypothetical protein